ncbi:response regulator transcription factor [Sphingobium lactosutens]|uniref:response regulator transcription factor n=1 Tax=Sphingobium lactosutens TaxID=522773 RepID=UPI001C4C6B56|nr:response regulator transcription factor [Sphingobium lactosutens]
MVEDEVEMVTALREIFLNRGIVMNHAETLSEARIVAETYTHDVIILDRQLPDGDGLELISYLRADGNLAPVLVLTARGEISHKVEGLDHGADDYLAKPFAVEELLARIRALGRRPSNLQSDLVTAARLSYDYVSREVVVDGKTLELTRREHLVLETLLRHLGRMVMRPILMEAVFSMDDEVQPNALDTHVSRLRRKLSDANSGLVINGVRGVGYLLREEQ